MTDPTKPRHDVALWAGIAAFFGSLLAIGAIDVFDLDGIVEFASSVIVALITAGGVYAKERLDAAKREEGHGNTTPPEQTLRR